MYPKNKEDHQYNLAAETSYKQEIYLMQKAQEYGEFCVLCERQKMKLLTFEDYLKLCNDNQ